MRKGFHVRSSDGVSSYAVMFEYDGSGLQVKCDCKAGMLGQMCRHKERLILGDGSVLSVADDLSDVLRWVAASPVQQAIDAVREAESKTRAAQIAEKSAKKALANLLFGK